MSRSKSKHLDTFLAKIIRKIPSLIVRGEKGEYLYVFTTTKKYSNVRGIKKNCNLSVQIVYFFRFSKNFKENPRNEFFFEIEGTENSTELKLFVK